MSALPFHHSRFRLQKRQNVHWEKAEHSDSGFSSSYNPGTAPPRLFSALITDWLSWTVTFFGALAKSWWLNPQCVVRASWPPASHFWCETVGIIQGNLCQPLTPRPGCWHWEVINSLHVARSMCWDSGAGSVIVLFIPACECHPVSLCKALD